ncbi:hypothetical protein K505DRAFT_295878 [Melanomma pulvis-pyrius CBS 109.77]|uniref:Uncharacterized protein n=1 Tax=Melanomma pulvis-pyrius CBS 109.77 TaxID=1314802 RepID=A0A6A6XQS4_9PLEO|nr:hypothetical protein K505DRAFT_295878 [Melanomma pulvis-pyrius CBS 109.77]
MSSQPLLPSYASATEQPRQNGYHLGQGRERSTQVHSAPSAKSLLKILCFITFATTAFVSSYWASQSIFTPLDEIPPESAPLLPYFSSLSLIISFCLWVGYIVLVAKDVGSGPRIQRQIVVGASVFGKLILAVAHAAISYGYERSFPEAKKPNWMLMFLAAQAWWDVFLIGVNSCLQSTAQVHW